ncbi:hypothetical protein PUN28_009504 [Cardiocondyla obscurior]|uniref:Odorant receptor n=1 Tax=Cardiocondyla obscurior TaxID=286306 RepID=A0AAW2FSZ6_9HYME
MTRGANDSRLEQFRKLSLLHLTYLKYVGLWALDSNSSVFFKYSYYVYNKSILTVILVFMVTLFADICSSFDDLSIVTDDGCIFAGIVVVFFKVMIFQTRHEQIVRLLQKTIDACDRLCKFPTIIGIDSLITNLCNLFLVQLEILNAHFKSCGENRRADDNDKRDDSGATGRNACHGVSSTVAACYGKDNYNLDAIRRGFAKRFGLSIRNHQRLLAIIDDFNKIFSAGMFVQMLSSTTMICLTGFQATSVIGQNSNIYKFAIYLMAAVSQLFYFCWIGNEVIHQSASLTQSQWLSKWNDVLSVKETSRLLILSIIFSRKSVNLKAGVFYVLSMDTFTSSDRLHLIILNIA